MRTAWIGVVRAKWYVASNKARWHVIAYLSGLLFGVNASFVGGRDYRSETPRSALADWQVRGIKDVRAEQHR